MFNPVLNSFPPPSIFFRPSLPCTPGKYGHLDINNVFSICSNCPENKFSKITQQTECLSCLLGRSSALGSVSCSVCPAGKHISDEGGCSDCAKGKHQPGMEQSSCLDCANGFHQQQEGQASCLPCSPGRYGQFNGSVGYKAAIECDTCPSGTASSLVARKTTCDECIIGRHQPDPGMTQYVPLFLVYFFPPSSRSSVVPHQTSNMPDPMFCSFCLCCFFPCFSTFFSDACHAFQVCTRKSRSRLTALSVTKIHIRTRQATARARAAVRASTRIEKEAPRAFHAVREATELGAILAPQVFIEGKRTGKI